MGVIFSKLNDYFNRKFGELKQFAWDRVERTKRAIRGRVDCAKQCVCNKVVGAKDAVVGKIIDTKTAACTRVSNAVTAVVVSARTTRDEVVCSICNKVTYVRDRVCAVRDRVHATVTSAKNAVTSRVNAAVSAVVWTKDAVVDRARRTKNASVERYVQSKEAIRNRYNSIRNAKLTRWQKVKYGALAVVVMFILAVILLTMLDVYLEDYASAKYRLAFIWWCTCTMVQFTWDMSVAAATYSWHGTQFAAEKMWQGSKVAAHYGRVGAEFAGRQIYAGSIVAAKYAVVCSKIAAEYVVNGAEMVTRCTWIGCKHSAIMACHIVLVLADCTMLCTQVCWEYACAATLVGGHYVAEGGKLSAQYAAKGCAYAYEHGTTAVAQGSVSVYHYSVYFVTNFRKASSEVAVWSWATLQSVVSLTCSAGCTSGHLLLCATSSLAHNCYEMSYMMVHWLYTFSVSAASWTAVTVTKVVIFTKEFAITAANFTISACIAGYDATITTAVALYNGSMSLSEWCILTAKVTWSWLTTAVVNVSSFLYVAVSDYGIRWATLVCNWLVDVSYFLGHIVGKFFGDLAAYIANFVYVTSSRILAVIYIIISFVYHIASAIASVIRVIMDVAVFCTTHMFGAIIWFLRETLFAYMYMLHQYNIYRELLFLVFIALLTVYCTGLMRDRRRLPETGDGSDNDSSEDDDEAHSRDETLICGDHQTETPELPALQQQEVMPSHEEVDDDLSDIELPEHIEDVEDRGLEEEDLLPPPDEHPAADD